jgi:NAD(P)H-dependent flavin oxidoreductase YrpB (nitropropane dioxygenase family)
MLEVVSTSRNDELTSVRAAADAGFDWVLGGTHAVNAAALLAGSDIRYCPFPGRIVGHPSVLEGEINEIARSAAELTALDGVHGVDLLAYRHATADVGALTTAVVQASNGPVIAAGSVVDEDQITILAKAGAWGFTIGGAIFEGRLPGGPDVAAQVRHVLAVAA